MAIESLEEAARNHAEQGVEAARRKYREAIHAIYAPDRRFRPTQIGSCFALRISGGKYLITAAHVVDQIKAGGGYVQGRNGLEPLLGDFWCSKKPDGSRNDDKLDFAWKKLGRKDIEHLGWRCFVDEADICANKDTTCGRLYLLLGFPRSKNKKANPISRKIRPRMMAYYSTGKQFSDLFAELGLTGDEHIAIDYAPRSKAGDGASINSIHPRGASGGPFLDLGRKGTLSDFARGEPYEGRLAGIFIERDDRHHALLAVKIDFLVAAIRAHAPGKRKDYRRVRSQMRLKKRALQAR